MSDVFEQLDEAVERVQRLRERLLADVEAWDRAGRLAVVFECEARLWSQLFVLCPRRLVCRAALAAEVFARQQARDWRQCAAGDTSQRPAPVPVAVAAGRAA
jgi:hypothetical protein